MPWRDQAIVAAMLTLFDRDSGMSWSRGRTVHEPSYPAFFLPGTSQRTRATFRRESRTSGATFRQAGRDLALGLFMAASGRAEFDELLFMGARGSTGRSWSSDEWDGTPDENLTIPTLAALVANRTIT
jgi:hypothetical protein